MSESGTSILLVDDSEAKRYAAAEVLRRAGFSVIEASTGAEALSRAWEEPGLVILDVKLPDMDGFEVARRLRQTPAANAPVLHLSATFVRSEHQARGLEAGAVSYLTYPLEPAVLVAQARSLMRLSRAERERSKILARERIARAQAESSRARFRFLSELGRLLTTTHRPAQMLREALELMVPSLVDGAAILLNHPGPDRLTVRHVNPAREEGFAAWVRGGAESLLIASELRDETAGHRLSFEDADPTDLDGSPKPGVPRDVLLLAIRYSGELEGALLVLRRAGASPMAGDDLLMFKEISGRLGSALASAHVFVVAERERERAEAANAAKDRFVATISHELRTPLTAQLTWLGYLKRGELETERVAKALEVIERNARLQIKLIDDLLDLSRSISGKLSVVHQPVDLLGVVEAAAEGLRGAAEEAGIDVMLPPRRPGAAWWMRGDPARLQQVVSNLLSNAIKFSPRGTRIELGLRADGDRLHLSIRDHGRGLQPAQLERIFDPFWQAELGERQSHGGGMGLGLAIVHALVAQHQGSITAHSDGPGQGMRFEIDLPRALHRDAHPDAHAPSGVPDQ